jgi:serralysin
MVLPTNNDLFANRLRFVPDSTDAENQLVTLIARLFGNNFDSTGEQGEPLHGGSEPDRTVWTTWTAPASGIVQIDTNDSDFDTTLGVYTGSSVNGLTIIGDDDDSGTGLQSLVVFNAIVGKPYQIAIDGFGSAEGFISLNVYQPLWFTQTGTSNADSLNGNSLNDVIRGLGGNDTLNSNGGTDTLLGGNGNDTIYSNGGDDYIDSGLGNDTIWLSNQATIALTTGEGYDTINNFQIGQNRFYLDGLTFGQLSFANSDQGVRITGPGNDLLAIVSWQSTTNINQATNFI